MAASPRAWTGTLIALFQPGEETGDGARGTVDQDVPVNHSPRFAPVRRPALDTGVQALVVAALEYVGTTNVTP